MKFNTLLKRKSRKACARNHAGGDAFRQSLELELVSMLLTSFLEDKFYRSGSETATRLRALVAEIPDKKFVAKAAIFARTKAGMRSVSHLVAGEIAQQVKGAEWTKRFFDRVTFRVDDALEILAYTLALYGKPVPNALKKGVGAAFARFDGYQLAKYRSGGGALKLVDAVNLVHPPHTKPLRELVNGTLSAAATWETRLTQAGQHADGDEDKARGKAAAWAELVRSRRIGYFALLRNLRNILEQAPDVMDDALAMLRDPELVLRSKVLPFRFRTALDAIERSDLRGRETVMGALGEAVDKALANVPRFRGRTLIAMDCSGSMIGRPMKIGSLFASVLYKANDADLMLFSGDAKFVAFDKGDSTLTIARGIEAKAEWSGTNFHAIFEKARIAYDRVVILSDMQGWMGQYAPTETFERYMNRVGARPLVYSFDLAGHGTLQFPERAVFCLAGFSDKTLETMRFLEEDKRALLRQIEAIEL